jgi:hypothetical protein
MNVNFAVTTPDKWAVDALNSRSNSILSPVSNVWSTQRTPWARVLSSAILDKNASYRNEYALWSRILNSYDTSYDKETGRPRFGIESIEVDFKGTMGSTRSCIVNFKCWTLDDLQILEKLYMVPGMSVIVEWGWSVSSEGAAVSPLNGFTVAPTPNKNFMPDIMEKVYQYRQQYKGSYDGLVGLVTNFNYSVNDQLGFDCSFELTSPGEMWLESNSTTVSRNCKTNANDKQKKQSNLQKQFHKIYKETGPDDALRNAYNTKYDGLPVITKQVWEIETREYDKQLRTSFEEFYEGKLDSINPARESNEIYISWTHFVEILNREINLYYYPKSREVKADPDLTYSNPKLGNSLIPITILPKMMSLDPRICTFDPIGIDPKAGKERAEDVAYEANETPPEKLENANLFIKFIDKAGELGKDILTGLNNYVVATTTPAELRPCFPIIPKLDNLDATKKQIIKCGDSKDKKNLDKNKNFTIDPYVGLLNNVYLNAGYLRDCITSGEEVNMQDLLSKILSDLNLASGGLWDLQYHVDELDPTRLQIYDANYTSAESRKKQIQPYEFSIKKLLLRNVVIESKLVEGFKTMVLYGNADDEGNGNPTYTGMKLYSEGVGDGFRPDFNAKQNNQCDDAKAPSTNSEIDEPVLDVDAAYYVLLDAVDDESVSNAKNSMKAYIGYLNTSRKDISTKLPRQQNILLPFNFSVTIDGFSGFIWGNAINLDYLPERYKGKIYYQVTKVKHSISATDWTTNIETVMRLINTEEATNTYEKPAYSPTQIKKETLDAANQQFAAPESTGGNVQQTKNLYQKNPDLQVVKETPEQEAAKNKAVQEFFKKK